MILVFHFKKEVPQIFPLQLFFDMHLVVLEDEPDSATHHNEMSQI